MISTQLYKTRRQCRAVQSSACTCWHGAYGSGQAVAVLWAPEPPWPPAPLPSQHLGSWPGEVKSTALWFCDSVPSMVSVMQAREILCSIINDDVLLILLALTGLSPYSVHPVETWPAEEPLWWDAVRVWHFQDGWFPPCRLIGQLPMAAGTCSQAALRSPQAVHSATAQAPSLSSRQGWAS